MAYNGLVPSTRRSSVVALLAVMLGVAVGCSDDARLSSDGRAPTSSAAQGSDPVDLVGGWVVTADGEEPGAVLLLGGELSLWRACGHLSGDWGADNKGVFVGSIYGGSGPCVPGSLPTIPWLRDATAYQASGADMILLDDDGHQVARLTPGGRPTAGPHTSETLAEPPTADGMREHLSEPEPLPVSLEPAEKGRLVGRWVPNDKRLAETDSHLKVDSDGTWSGSDGCNGTSGAWRSSTDGGVLATIGPSTLVGCLGAPVGHWFADAARAGFDGDVLVFVDRGGKELGRVRPSG